MVVQKLFFPYNLGFYFIIMANPISDEEAENYCFVCQEDNHTSNNCPKQKCKNCHQSGHNKLNCPLIMSQVSPNEQRQEDDEMDRPPSSPLHCSVCQNFGHEDLNCPTLKCRNCDKVGHISIQCPKLDNLSNRPGPSTAPQEPTSKGLCEILYEHTGKSHTVEIS